MTRSNVDVGQLPSPSSSSEISQPSSPPPLPPPSSNEEFAEISSKNAVENPMPESGCVSLQGLSVNMEDAWFVTEDLCRPSILGGNPVHYFAVFDGHGGTRVSELCKNMMHSIIAEELTQLTAAKAATACDVVSKSSGIQPQTEVKESKWKYLLSVALNKGFQRTDEMAISTCLCAKPRNTCTSGCRKEELIFCGSTAVVALLTSSHIVVASCGDSRAILCHNEETIPLTQDHKPDRPDERKRILASGGRISNKARVNGILNMSRSIGDVFLKKIITSEPEVSVTERRAEDDDCLILATNGFWDYVPNEIASNIARTCLKKNKSRIIREDEDDDEATMSPSSCHLAATALTRMALARGSKDNITVIVVDLRRPQAAVQKNNVD